MVDTLAETYALFVALWIVGIAFLIFIVAAFITLSDR